MEALLQDPRFAVRQLAARRGFTAIVMLTAALLCCVALAASWWPARVAMRIDPMAVLKR